MDVKYIGIHCMRKNGVYKQEQGHPYFIPTLTLNYLLQNMECSRRWTYADGENGRWGVAVKCNFFRIRIIHYALPHIMYSCRFKCSSGHTGDVLKNVDRLKDFSAKGVTAYFQVPYKPQVRKLVTLKSRLVPCWCITSYRGTLHFPIRHFSNYVLPDKCTIFLFFREDITVQCAGFHPFSRQFREIFWKVFDSLLKVDTYCLERR